MTTATYPNDLTLVESLTTLEEADAYLSKTLHGSEWTRRVVQLIPAPTYPEDSLTIDMTALRPEDMAALRDASTMLTRLIWRNGATPLAPIPNNIQMATSLLAAHLIKKASQPIDAEAISFTRIGETSASFRTPNRDDLPRHVRTLVEQYLVGTGSSAPIRP